MGCSCMQRIGVSESCNIFVQLQKKPFIVQRSMLILWLFNENKPIFNAISLNIEQLLQPLIGMGMVWHESGERDREKNVVYNKINLKLSAFFAKQTFTFVSQWGPIAIAPFPSTFHRHHSIILFINGINEHRHDVHTPRETDRESANRGKK